MAYVSRKLRKQKKGKESNKKWRTGSQQYREETKTEREAQTESGVEKIKHNGSSKENAIVVSSSPVLSDGYSTDLLQSVSDVESEIATAEACYVASPDRSSSIGDRLAPMSNERLSDIGIRNTEVEETYQEQKMYELVYEGYNGEEDDRYKMFHFSTWRKEQEGKPIVRPSEVSLGSLEE